jgi:hypothetical protein
MTRPGQAKEFFMTQTPSRAPKFLFLSAVALAVLAPGIARAGFEWKGPITPPMAKSAPATPSAPAAPTAEGEMKGLEPVITWDGSSGAMPSVKTQAVEQAPVAAPAAPDAIEGFGADVPLVIALQQVSPAGYRVSFGPGVNPGTIISWKGGKPWKDVLTDALAPAHLAYRVEDNTIIVVQGAAPQAKPESKPAAKTESKPQPQPEAKVTEKAPEAPLPLTAPPAAESQQRVLIGRATETGTKIEQTPPPPATTPPPPVAPEPPQVDVRREKHTSLLDKLGIHLHKEEDKNKKVVEDKKPEAAPAPVKDEALPPPVDLKPEKPAATSAPVPATAAESAPPPMPLTAQGAAMEKPAPVAPSPAVTPAWRAEKGQTLRAVLKSWSATAGVEMYWSIDYDYKLEKEVAFSGTYDEAVSALLEKFSSAKPQPYGKLHQSSDGPRVLVIKAYGPQE